MHIFVVAIGDEIYSVLALSISLIEMRVGRQYVVFLVCFFRSC
jgi:hypothetical protein